MAREHVLLVEDEQDICELLDYNLAKNGFRATCVSSGEEGLKAALRDRPELVLLDLMLPGLDGLEVCRRLKADPRTAQIPIVMLTARGEEADVVAGLELGADDYVIKPFSPRVLIARVRAVLRRGSKSASAAETELVRVGPLVIDPGRREVRADGRRIALTLTEFGVLHLLACRPGWVFTRGQIVEGVRGPDVVVTDRSVDVHIVSLRRKLGAFGQAIETVRGVGYRLKDD